MKKLVTLTLALVLTAALALNAFAAGTITPPVYPGDYKTYDPTNAPETAENNVIPGWGYIGPDATLTPDPNPEVEPEVVPEDVSKFLHIEVPTQFMWAAFQSANGAVTAPTYKIVNKNTKANVQVTMKSFQQVAGDELPTGSTLVLNLTDDLELADVLGVSAQEHLYTTLLGASQEWEFSIDGTYTGIFPVEYVQPQYEMVLGFAVDSFTA